MRPWQPEHSVGAFGGTAVVSLVAVHAALARPVLLRVDLRKTVGARRIVPVADEAILAFARFPRHLDLGIGDMRGRGAVAVLATDVAVLAAVLLLELLLVALAAGRNARVMHGPGHFPANRLDLMRPGGEQRLGQDHEA